MGTVTEVEPASEQSRYPIASVAPGTGTCCPACCWFRKIGKVWLLVKSAQSLLHDTVPFCPALMMTKEKEGKRGEDAF